MVRVPGWSTTCNDSVLILSSSCHKLLLHGGGRAFNCGLGSEKVKEEMITMCPLDSPQLSTTLLCHRHRHPSTESLSSFQTEMRSSLNTNFPLHLQDFKLLQHGAQVVAVAILICVHVGLTVWKELF